MRIAHVVQRFHPLRGGAETHVREIAAEQARRGHDVVVHTSAHAAPSKETMNAGDGATFTVHRHAVRTWRGQYLWPPWLVMPGLADALAASEWDIVHAHSYRFHTLEAAEEASRRTKRPYVVTAHGFYPPENALVAAARWRYDAQRGGRMLRNAARCVAVTSHEIEYYERFGIPRERIDVVPNGIPEAAFEPGDGARFRRDHDLAGRIVLFLARLGHDKGLVDLVAAAPRVLALEPDVVFAVCGRDAGARKRAVKLARQLGVFDSVRFLGEIPEPRDAYSAADVLAHPSHYEAFGIVLLEAMAQGTPVIATTAGGMPEVVADAGILVPPRDPAALARALVDLLRDEDRRGDLAKRGLERAREHLWPRIVDRLEDTYSTALRNS